ncbi:hypothetical protein HZH68_003844 [Vespula germanica]|uniref:Uncharacterized protein n=1 Tax=Vespula germanica TaxID=30212 RepID=A0A834KMK6_VESGE|nr:hypothetical protein HZH68_003844 [Vespula germanica]
MEILFAEKYCGIVGGGGLRVDRGRVRGVRGGSRGGGGGGERRGGGGGGGGGRGGGSARRSIAICTPI